MDGFRAYWNVTKLLSKHGREIITPANFTAGLPPIELDGELWMGRGNYEKLVGVLKTKGFIEQWKEVTYQIFDLPGSASPFEQRQQEMKALKLPPNASVITYTECGGTSHLYSYLDLILAGKG